MQTPQSSGYGRSLLATLNKHLPDQHDQQSHAGGGEGGDTKAGLSSTGTSVKFKGISVGARVLVRYYDSTEQFNAVGTVEGFSDGGRTVHLRNSLGKIERIPAGAIDDISANKLVDPPQDMRGSPEEMAARQKAEVDSLLSQGYKKAPQGNIPQVSHYVHEDGREVTVGLFVPKRGPDAGKALLTITPHRGSEASGAALRELLAGRDVREAQKKKWTGVGGRN